MSNLFDISIQPIPKTLQEKYIITPFSILDTQSGYWQQRKRYWISLGITSELGRNENITNQPDIPIYARKLSNSRDFKFAPSTSIFDPVVCEIAYKWFSRENDKIIDPFAGGSVRGLVAGMLKRNYTGIDLSEKQIEVNKQQYEEISKKYTGILKPNWINGDSLNCKELANDKYNLLFTCPPYYDLEVYSDKENDLSNKGTYEEFIDIYRQIIKNACDMLEDNSFAVIVVGDIRDKDGFYRDFISDTKKAFINVGVKLYNEMILIEQIGSAGLRVNRYFNSSRKIVKRHQNVLVFYKGNPSKIKEKFGSFEDKE